MQALAYVRRRDAILRKSYYHDFLCCSPTVAGMRFVLRAAACGERNDANAVAGLRGAEAAARAVLRTAILTRVSPSRGRSDFGRKAAAATER